MRGLDAVPATRPILFVGNHQTMAFDLGVLVEELLRARGVLVRGLAHPAIFGATRRLQQEEAESGGMGVVGQGLGGPGDGTHHTADGARHVADGARAADGSPRATPSPPAFPAFLRPRTPPPRTRAAGFEGFMSEFGAVPVGGRNFFTLLRNGEAVLLFPGGAREAYKRKGEQYALFWPEREEFVRMAARFGATIVPFAAVGCEDSLRLLLDSDELLQLPVVGPALEKRVTDAIPRARRGVAADAALEDGRFVAPLALPTPPERLYFQFRAPMQLTPDIAADREAAAAVYARVKEEVGAGIEWLCAQRERDPYRQAAARLPYEALAGGQAPTFPLEG